MKTKYIIYGAASIGKIVKEALENLGIDVLGYIDKRSFELDSYNNVPVWSINDPLLEGYYEDVVVFIGVKNVFEHEKITRILAKKGFKYIVYKAYGVLMGKGTADERTISEQWDILFNQEQNKLPIEIPLCPVLNTSNLYDYAVIQETDTHVIAYIPTEFIFTNNYNTGGMVKWGNVNILSFFTHIDFFRFLDNKFDSMPEDYLKEYCIYTAELQNVINITDAWKENVIQNRKQIYEKMCEAINLDRDFFLRNAPEAMWNEDKKYFNLLSGKHRSSFLAAKGFRYIPLKITKTDYERFYNKDEVLAINKLLVESEPKIIITHPCFYRDDRNIDNGEYNFLIWFARYYGKKLFYKYGKVNFSEMTLIDYCKDEGMIARYVLRNGGQVYRNVVPTNMEIQLNRLFHSEILYNNKVAYSDRKTNILILEENHIDEISISLGLFEEIIIKYCQEKKIIEICDKYGLSIQQKINSQYDSKTKRSSYLLRLS